MQDALIGYTGFVGSNIHAQQSFDALFNSSNFREMGGREFGDVICAGVSAVKWMANKEPEKDRQQIKQLEDVLATIRARRFVLISTIDVYPVITGKDETFDCGSLENNAYGAHRLAFERFCTSRFQHCTVIRLPGLFGNGLKKNVIYDLLHHNCLEMINPASSFQYYCLDSIGSDIQKTLAMDCRLINLFTQPVTTQTIIERFFADETFDGLGSSPAPEIHYDLRTCHAAEWGGAYGYIMNTEAVLNQLENYLDRARNV